MTSRSCRGGGERGRVGLVPVRAPFSFLFSSRRARSLARTLDERPRAQLLACSSLRLEHTAMRRWPLLLLAGLLLLQKRPGDAYAVVPRSSCSRALLQKDVDDEKTNVPPGGANKRPPRFPPDDDPADFPPRVAEMLAGYLDNKALVRWVRALAPRRYALFFLRAPLSLNPSHQHTPHSPSRPPDCTPSPPGARPRPPAPTPLGRPSAANR